MKILHGTSDRQNPLLQPSDFERIQAVFSKHDTISYQQLRNISRLMFELGLRVSDCLSLTRQDALTLIDQYPKPFEFIEQKTDSIARSFGNKPKVRKLALSPKAKRAFERQLKISKGRGSDWLFVALRNSRCFDTPLRRQGVYALWRKHIARCYSQGALSRGVPRPTLHSIRKATALRMLQQFDNDWIRTQHWMGHARASSTATYLLGKGE